MGSIVLQFLKGPLSGKAVTLQRSVSVGRKGTDISVDDPKLSQIHAFIQILDGDTWVIIDNNSHNGIIVGGKKVKKIQLFEGLEIQLGQSLVRCHLPTAEETAEKVTADRVDAFVQWLQVPIKMVENGKKQVSLLNPQINLVFVEGIQFGTTWEVFYAPRAVGFNNLDLPLYEDGLPENLFGIEAIGRQPFLRVHHFDRVRVNGESVEKKKLVHGDVIQVGHSKIQVEMILK